MRQLKICTILFSLIFINFAIFGQTKIKLYADDNYRPYSYISDNGPKGIYFDIVTKAINDIPGYEVEVIAVPWSRALRYIKEGIGFAIYPPFRHMKKRPYIKSYSAPILVEEIVVACNLHTIKKLVKTPQWPDDFYGLTIGNNSSYIVAGEKFYKALNDKDIYISTGKSTKINMSKLIHGHIDCYVNDRQAILWELKAMRASDKVQIVSVVSKQSGLVGFSNSSKYDSIRDDFIDKFNNKVLELRSSGFILRVMKKYLK